MTWLNLHFPLRFLRGNAGSVALTVVAIGCAVAQVYATDLVSRSVAIGFGEVIDTMAGRVTLQVRLGEEGSFAEELVDSVSIVPGVTQAIGVLSTSMFDSSGEFLTVHAFDLGRDEAVQAYDFHGEETEALDDPHLLLPDSVVLTKAYAARAQVRKGDRISFETPAGKHGFTVRALLEAAGMARVFGGNLVLMDVEGAQEIFARPGLINRIDVLVDLGADTDVTADAVAAVLPAGFRVERPEQRKVDLHRVIRSVQIFLRGIGVIGLIAAFLIAFNRLSAVFEARVWQLGVLRSVGLRRLIVWRELLKESVFLGFAGVAVGLPAGVAVAHYTQPMMNRAFALASNQVTPSAVVHFPLSALLAAAGLGMAATLLAAALPAWRAAKLAVAAVLRSHGREQTQPAKRFKRRIAVLLAAGIGLAITLQWQRGSSFWGIVATALIATEAVVLSGCLVDRIPSLFRHAIPALVGPAGRLAIAGMHRSRRRNALTVATIGVGLGAVLWIWAIAVSFKHSVIDSLVGAGALHADLVVSSARVGSGFLEYPVDESLVRKIANVPGVDRTVGQRTVQWRFDGGPILIDAFDAQYFRNPRFRPAASFARGPPDLWDQVAAGKAAAISENLALHHGIEIGDPIVLDTADGRLTLPIAGVARFVESPWGSVWIERGLYKRHWKDEKVTRVFVGTLQGTNLDVVRTRITETLGREYHLRIFSARDLVTYFSSQVGHAFAGVNVLAGVILCVVLMGIADSLAASVLDRTRELGTLRAVGVSRLLVRRVILIEGALLGSSGLFLALLLGFAMGTLWIKTTFSLLLGWVIEGYVPYAQVSVLGVLWILVCYIASALPARRAARIDPAVALRCD